MEQIEVDLGAIRYPILVQAHLLSSLKSLDPYLSSEQVMVVTNELIAPLYLKKIQALLKDKQPVVITLPDGESEKSFANFQVIINQLIQHGFRRNSTLIALGGGVIGDLTGFVASCYQRGVNFIQIPTTLLSMVDSSVGGKTAINHENAKNMIGAFHHPKVVLSDVALLQTLPEREFRSGLAEIVKYGLIDDFNFFEFIESSTQQINDKNDDIITQIIVQSCKIKSKIVQADEKEKGIRATLNLGHTFAHALEKAGNYQDLKHGEAVAIGILLAFRLSAQVNKITQDYLIRVETLLDKLNLLDCEKQPYNVDMLIDTMRLDKKNKSSAIRLILPTGKGQVDIFDDIADDVIRSVWIDYFQE